MTRKEMKSQRRAIKRFERVFTKRHTARYAAAVTASNPAHQVAK